MRINLEEYQMSAVMKLLTEMIQIYQQNQLLYFKLLFVKASIDIIISDFLLIDQFSDLANILFTVVLIILTFADV